MTMKRRTRTNPKGLSQSISAASATMLGKGVEVDSSFAPAWVTSAPTDEADGFDVKDWNAIHVTAVCERAPASVDLCYARIRVWRYYKTHPSRLADARTVGRWVQDYDRIYTLNQLSMSTESQHRVYATRNADKMCLQIVEVTAEDVNGVPVDPTVSDIRWIHIQPWGLIRKDEQVPFDLTSDPALGGTLNVDVGRPEPDIRLLHNDDFQNYAVPGTIYFPSAAGIAVRDPLGRERRNVATYAFLAPTVPNGSVGVLTLRVEEDISNLGDWVNVSSVGSNLQTNTKGVLQWTVTGPAILKVRVDHNGVRGHRVRWAVDVSGDRDTMRLIVALTEEN